MLEQFFHSAIRIQALRNGPSGALLEGFAQELSRCGYAEITARRHIRAAEHFIYWAAKEGIPGVSFNKQLVTRFDEHLSRCRCAGYRRKHRFHLLHSARLLVSYVCGTGVDVGRAAAEEAAEYPILLAQFREWMREQRGSGDRTLYKYSIPLRNLLKRIGEDPGRLNAQSLREFVLEQGHKSGRSGAKTCTTALRMFLRFLIAKGMCTAGLDAAIPVVAHWRLSSLPRYLQAEEVERVIASCNPSSPVGKRNRAILLLLARLGLRAGDIVQLRMADIDWRSGWISLSGKGKRETRLPLTQEVGQAIVAYLQNGRPQSDANAVFVRSQAPFRAFASNSAVSLLVARAMRRVGVKCPSGGAAQVLRHSAASSMLRQGASLQDIAAILRHRSIETTQIYAKVDVTALQRIAQPWPEVQPC
jgi:integrase/recombinase XerD